MIKRKCRHGIVRAPHLSLLVLLVPVCSCLFASQLLSACAYQSTRSAASSPANNETQPNAATQTAPGSVSNADLVRFPSAEVEFIAGPQLKSGSALNPTPWFDQNALGKGLEFGAAFPEPPGAQNLGGTIALAQNSKDVVGTGTHFIQDFRTTPNAYFLIRDSSGVHIFYRAAVADDTHMQLSAPWMSASVRGLNYSGATAEAYDAYSNLNYYDQALVQYINYYRTGDERFLTHARKIADSWWRFPQLAEGHAGAFDNSLAPRTVSLSGLMLRALDGRPEMWSWIVDYTRAQYDLWIGQRKEYTGLYYGTRESGYMLLYAAQLARVHPSPGVRAEFRRKALDGAVNYFARLQYPDGSWRWGDPSYWKDFGTQPFHVGILLEGMIAVHRLTGDERVARSIVKGTEAMYQQGYNPKGWRAMYYLVHGTWPSGMSCETGCGAAAGAFPPADAGQVAEARQLNATCIHAFGYAYLLSDDVKFRRWGDELLDATFGRRDSYRGLAWSRPKEYDESYRAGGHYLAWRLGGSTPPPTPVPTPVPTPDPAGTNVALASNGATATASSTHGDGFPAAAAIDGERGGANWAKGGGWNDATENVFPDWLEVAFSKAQTISRIVVYTLSDDYDSPAALSRARTFTMYGITDFSVQFFDGSNWLAVPGGSITGNQFVKREVTFAPVTTTKIRVVVKKALGGFSRIIEVEAYTGASAAAALAPK